MVAQQHTTDLAEHVASLPLSTRFTLGADITAEQQAFLDLHGFLIFDRVASQEECTAILDEMYRVQQKLIASGAKDIFGIPLMYGKDPDGETSLQRVPFSSVHSEFISDFVRDDRFSPVRSLIGTHTRVGDREKDGVVFNTYCNTPGSMRPGLGWHTDGLRSLAYGRMPGPMLNVGLHFDRITKEDGGLVLIPGTHNQGFMRMAFGKPYFISHRPDPKEVYVETHPGDLTVHDGRLWHRVQANPKLGRESLRRSMYVPYLTDTYSPKDESSTTPLYHRVFRAFNELKAKSIS